MDAVIPQSSQQIAAPAVPAEQGAGAIDALFDDSATLKELVQLCLWNLGHGATFEDAEDALYEFYARHLQDVIGSYKPGPRSLVDYFKFCLKRFCWGEGRKTRKRIPQSEPLEDDCKQTGGHEEADALEKLATEQRESRLGDAFRQLPPDDQRLLELRYEEGLSFPKIKIGAHLHISGSAAKLRHFRLIRRLRLTFEGEQ